MINIQVGVGVAAVVAVGTTVVILKKKGRLSLNKKDLKDIKDTSFKAAEKAFGSNKKSKKEDSMDGLRKMCKEKYILQVGIVGWAAENHPDKLSAITNGEELTDENLTTEMKKNISEFISTEFGYPVNITDYNEEIKGILNSAIVKFNDTSAKTEEGVI